MKSLPSQRSVVCILLSAQTTTHAWSGNSRGLANKKRNAAVTSLQLSESPAAILLPVSRREILATTVAFSAAASGSFLAPQKADAAVDPGEAIRRGAANIPGYGQSDVYYPESFAGSWKMTRDVEFPSSSSASPLDSNAPPPVLRLTYPVRFLQSIEDGAVVADRGYNQAELEAALAQRQRRSASESPSSSSSPPAVQSYDWAANNPNVLRVALTDGTRKEIKVTKRATERTGDTVSSSEFQRITQEDTREMGGPGGIPQITARRVVSKWKTIDESTLEGIEIVYAVGGGGDPLSTSLAGPSNNNNAAPTILSKSRLYLVR